MSCLLIGHCWWSHSGGKPLKQPCIHYAIASFNNSKVTTFFWWERGLEGRADFLGLLQMGVMVTPSVQCLVIRDPVPLHALPPHQMPSLIFLSRTFWLFTVVYLLELPAFLKDQTVKAGLFWWWISGTDAQTLESWAVRELVLGPGRAPPPVHCLLTDLTMGLHVGQDRLNPSGL